MNPRDNQILLRLLLAVFGSLGIHCTVIAGHGIMMFLSYTPPVALMGGGGSSGMGGKPGEGGVSTVDASTSGFSLRRVLAKSDDGSDDNQPTTVETPEVELNPTEMETTRPPTDVALNVPPPLDPAPVYLTERPAPAVVKPAEIPKVERPAEAKPVEAGGPPRVARKPSAVARTGIVSVDVSELKAAAGRGDGIKGGTNGTDAGNGGGGRPGAGRGGGVGAGQGSGSGNLPSLAGGNRAPIYPPEAERLRQQGRVLLRVVVRMDGTPSSVELEKTSSFPSLDDAAIAAVKNWRFIPARQFSKPVESTVLVPVRFILAQ